MRYERFCGSVGQLEDVFLLSGIFASDAFSLSFVCQLSEQSDGIDDITHFMRMAIFDAKRVSNESYGTRIDMIFSSCKMET